MPRCDPSLLRVQLILVAAGYAAMLAIATVLVFVRYKQYSPIRKTLRRRVGCMPAATCFFEIFICCMLLIPTFLLALVIRTSENLYTCHAKILLGLSLTAQIFLGVAQYSRCQPRYDDPGMDLPGARQSP